MLGLRIGLIMHNCFFIVCLIIYFGNTVAKIPKIGIIGGGIGGTATAYFLQELFNNNVAIDLYEPGKIGGRLATSNSFKSEYETGGAIIHPKNFYMVHFLKILGLERNGACPEQLGIFDGKDYSFVESKYELLNLAKFLWRYGLDMYWLKKENDNMLNSFARIYKMQSEGVCFKTVSDLLAAMDPTFPLLIQKTFRDHLIEDIGLHDKIIDELITSVTRANYGQLADVHAFVGSVSVAAADENLWSVFGGNKRVPEELLKASGANRLKKQATKIIGSPTGSFQVYSRHSSEPCNLSADESDKVLSEDDLFVEYDAIAIAAPMTVDKASLQLVNFPSNISFPGSYQKIFCTMVQGTLNGSTFRNKEVGEDISEILTFNPSLMYNSVGRQTPVNSKSVEDCKEANLVPVYKVFSPNELTQAQMEDLFEKYDKIEVLNWLAYPHYTSSDVMIDDFELVPGLYYNNAIEKAASAIEMSIIGAKNVALLIHEFLAKDESFKEQTRKIDEL